MIADWIVVVLIVVIAVGAWPMVKTTGTDTTKDEE